ncbi:PAS domain S-box protein [Leptothermofonsia sp. ETS-13]|uniref:hybrid sensor histidine kinase/response regulator n=1 Tax=Leptothermofonsia sp. ETS-13 TaxID=3035696 RepID=UPI003BA0BA25
MDDCRTILIIDDSADDRVIYRRFLQGDKHYTYYIVEAAQVSEALDLCRQAMPDAILVDFMLADSDGLEFLNQLKLQTGSSLLPVIFLTGYGDEMIAVQAMKSGAQDYLIKGKVTAEVLCRAIHSVIERVALLQQLEQSREQQRLALEQAHASERCYAALAAAAPVGIYRTDASGKGIYYNDLVSTITGLSPQELLNQQWSQALHPDDRDRVLAERTQALQSGSPLHAEYRFQHRDGKIVWVVERAVPQLDQNRQIVGYIGIYTDISDRKQAEAALKKSEARYRAIVEDQTEFITRFLPDTTLTFVNQAYCRYWESEPAEILNTSFLSHIPEEECNFVKQQLASLSIENPFIISEHRVKLPNGEIRWHRWRDRAIFNDQGEIIEYQSVGQDITEQIKAERMLQNLVEGTASTTGDDFFPALVRLIAQAFGVRYAIVTELVDNQFQTLAFWSNNQLQNNQSLRFSPTPCEKTLQQGLYYRPSQLCQAFPNNPELVALEAESYLGVALLDAAGNPLGSLCIIDDRPIPDPKSFEGILRVFAARAAAELERKRAINALQKLNAKLESRVAERMAELVNTVEQLNQEIRERKQIEAALRESESRFRSMANSAPVLLWMAGTDGICNFFNQSWLNFTGRTHEQECAGGWTENIHRDDLPEYLSVQQSAFSARREFQMEYRLKRADGVYRWILDNGKPRFTPEGSFAGYIGCCIDITERKQAEAEQARVEEEIRKALAKEKELNELKSRFVSMISHEFRTPLTTIQSATDLLRYYEWSPDEKQERFQQIYEAVQHMTQLLEDVLLIGKAEAGKLDFIPKPLDLEAICQQLVADFQLGTGSKHLLSFSSQGTVQEVWIDQKLLRQILTNLISNAVKYSPEGGKIELKLTYSSDRVDLQVQDEGIGILSHEMARLFETFFRGSNVGTIQGTGLGLATVKRCLDLHGGYIAVTSEVGKGTIFTVTLPLAQPLNSKSEPFFIDD